MPEYAILINNIVDNVIVAESLQDAIEHTNEACVEVTEATGLAHVGFPYNQSTKAFVQPILNTGWTLDENLEWKPPVEKPTDDEYFWDNVTLTWKVTNPANRG